MKELIVFVQASRDIQYSLGLYELYKDEFNIKLYVINSEGTYDFISKLNLPNCSVKLISNVSLRKVLNVLHEKIRLSKIYKKEFQGVKDAKVYFFSNYFDVKTFYFLSRLSDNNKVVMLDHYQIYRKPMKTLTLAAMAKLALLWFVTNIRFDISDKCNIVMFDFKKFGISSERVNDTFVNINKFRQKVIVKPNSVILFDSNDETLDLFKNYNSVLKEIVEFLKCNDYSIYLKPHPRLGYSGVLNDYELEVLDPEIPLELMETSNFTFAVGNITAALSGCETQGGTISYMSILDFIDEERKIEYKKYLLNLDSNIHFPTDSNEFKKIIMNL